MKSLDYLRLDASNLSHGLRFTTGATELSAQSGLNILADTRVEICASGHFRNWYTTLPTANPLYGIRKFVLSFGTNTGRAQIGSDKVRDLKNLIGKKYSLLDLLQTLPDLFQTMRRYKATIPSSRVSYECEMHVPVVPGPVTQINQKWRLHDTGTPTDLQTLLQQFKSPPGLDLKFDCQMLEGGTSCIVYHRSSRPDEDDFSFPSIREDMNLNAIMYAREYLPCEFVDAYIAAYGLSMLSRYYPDIWMASIESHCIATKVIDRFVDVMMERGPILAARLLIDEDLVISIHNPPWYN